MDKKGTMKTKLVITILVTVVVLVALLPTIANTIDENTCAWNGSECLGTNVTGASYTLMGLLVLLIVIVFFAMLARQAGGSR